MIGPESGEINQEIFSYHAKFTSLILSDWKQITEHLNNEEIGREAAVDAYYLVCINCIFC